MNNEVVRILRKLGDEDLLTLMIIGEARDPDTGRWRRIEFPFDEYPSDQENLHGKK